MQHDLSHAALEIREGRESASNLMELSIAAAQSPLCAHVFSQTFFDSARWAAAETPKAAPLAGLAISIKDLFDTEGSRSAASSVLLKDAPLAAANATAVERLRKAGAAIIGRTHMVEFAFSGVGVNPHFGTPAALDARHPANPQLAPTQPARVPGGSSSGAAVSIASGAAWAALGSDTGGSIRIPAALNGLVGFKSTARLVPLTGTVPLSPTLDTACAITRSVRDAVLIHEILAERKVPADDRPLSQWRLAVPRQIFFEQIEPAVKTAFEHSISQLQAAGTAIEWIDLPELEELDAVNAIGGFSPTESYAWHRRYLNNPEQAALYDPRVRSRIERGAQMSAADYLDLLAARKAWIAKMEAAIAPFDALLSPTTPICAPTIASVAPANGANPEADARHDAEFVRVNTLLLRNTSVVNMLDGCALSLPCHQAHELPMGLMIWHAALHDDAVLQISAAIEATLQAVN
ncbi:amidase [Comamonas testosteroni]|uniref:Amidase n=1 Tax=Comamonas testosteroni TaxID=285 RepID=A0A373FKM1_COMTE|nr:amidase [Comamonas testosteroni]RGE44721.1 amidase [Comamonas testosteroni]